MKDDQFEKWTQQWDAAQETEAFKSAPKPPQRGNPDMDFFGQYPTVSDTNINDVDAQYWHDVYRMSDNSGEAPDPLVAAGVMTDDCILSEEKKPEDVNPIHPDSRGKDQEIDDKAIWKEVDDLNELADLKVRLEKLESRHNASEASGKTSPQSQIDDLRRRIDNLSEMLSGQKNA